MTSAVFSTLPYGLFRHSVISNSMAFLRICGYLFLTFTLTEKPSLGLIGCIAISSFMIGSISQINWFAITVNTLLLNLDCLPFLIYCYKLDANSSLMRRHLDNIQNTLSACSQKFSDSQAFPDLTASLADKRDIEAASGQGFVSSLNEDNLNNTANFKFPRMMLEPPVANSKLHSELLNSRGDSSSSIHFSSSVISFSCIETLGTILDSPSGLKDDPGSYACKVFAEMPEKKIDMKVENLVIIDSENSASYMFDEMFQTVSAVKGEYSELIMLDNNRLMLPCLLLAGSHAQIMESSILEYFQEFNHAKIPLSLYRFHPTQFRFNISFDPDSNLSQFPFDLGANLFIIALVGCLRVSTLPPVASNWDPEICSKCMTRIELTTRASVYPWRKSLLVLLFALSNEHKVCHLDMNVSEICVRKIITATLGSYFIDYYFKGMLISSLLLVTLVTRVFHKQLDFIMLTTCSPEMAEFIKLEVLDDYWTGYFTKLTTDIFDDVLVVSIYHDVLVVAGQIRKEESAQILHWLNILDCILSLSKLMVSINYTRNVDTPLGSQNEAANSRNHVAWVFDISLRRGMTSFLVPLANKEYTVTKGYTAPKGHRKLLMSVISLIYNVEVVFFESLYLLKAAEWSLLVISKIWSTVMLIGIVVTKLPTPASNLLGKASFIVPMRILTMISILYYSNLEDKVLIGVVGIVMNGPRPILAKQPNNGLSGYVWDPG